MLGKGEGARVRTEVVLVVARMAKVNVAKMALLVLRGHDPFTPGTSKKTNSKINTRTHVCNNAA